jgi:hypothetical protein
MTVVELRWFGGLSVAEIASIMRVSTRTVKREWSFTKAWLYGERRSVMHDVGISLIAFIGGCIVGFLIAHWRYRGWP